MKKKGLWVICAVVRVQLLRYRHGEDDVAGDMSAVLEVVELASRRKDATKGRAAVAAAVRMVASGVCNSRRSKGVAE